MWIFTCEFRRSSRDETFRLRQQRSEDERKHKKDNGFLHRICS